MEGGVAPCQGVFRIGTPGHQHFMKGRNPVTGLALCQFWGRLEFSEP